MQITTYTCDICEKEFNTQEGVSCFVGALPKVDSELTKHIQQVKGDYCGKCTEVLMGLVGEIKKDINKVIKK